MDSGLQVLAIVAVQMTSKFIVFKAKLSRVSDLKSSAFQLSNNTLPAIGCTKGSAFFPLAKVAEQKSTEKN